VSDYQPGNDAMASCTIPEAMAKPKLPMIYNPILFVGLASIALWAVILTAVAFILH
jgi:hypothetical protein